MKTFRAKALDQVALATEVASLLPSASASARKDVMKSHETGHKRRMRVTFCPSCGGDKSGDAMTCRACAKTTHGQNRSRMTRIEQLPHAIAEPVVGIDSSRYVHTSGTLRRPPPQPRWDDQP